jgi:hypothetical protein
VNHHVAVATMQSRGRAPPRPLLAFRGGARYCGDRRFMDPSRRVHVRRIVIAISHRILPRECAWTTANSQASARSRLRDPERQSCAAIHAEQQRDQRAKAITANTGRDVMLVDTGKNPGYCSAASTQQAATARLVTTKVLPV